MLYSIPRRKKVFYVFQIKLPLVMIDPSIELLEHHLSATGMRDPLRQCRIEAESVASDAGASRSHTPVHNNVHLKKPKKNQDVASSARS